VNPTFCTFILDLTSSDQILHRADSHLLPKSETSEIRQQEQLLLQQDEHQQYQQGGKDEAKEFDVTIRKQNFRVMKQVTTLRDGQKVIIGTIISSF